MSCVCAIMTKHNGEHELWTRTQRVVNHWAQIMREMCIVLRRFSAGTVFNLQIGVP